jgi:hypothetical protein
MASAPDRQAFVAIFVSQDVVQTVTWATQSLIQRADQNTIAIIDNNAHLGSFTQKLTDGIARIFLHRRLTPS